MEVRKILWLGALVAVAMAFFALLVKVSLMERGYFAIGGEMFVPIMIVGAGLYIWKKKKMKRITFKTLVFEYAEHVPYQLHRYVEMEHTVEYAPDWRALSIRHKGHEFIVSQGDIIVLQPFNKLYIYPKNQ